MPTKKEIVSNYILSEIASGQLKENDMIMTEEQLADKFNVSRLTAHAAMTDLSSRGIIVRTAGKGSFVSGRPVLRSISRKQSFTDDMASIGMIAGAKLLEFRRDHASEMSLAISDLHANPDDEIYYFVRLRTGDGNPIAVQYTYLLASMIPDIDVSKLEGSLDAYLEQEGVKMGSYDTMLAAVCASPEQQRLLHVAKNSPLLRSRTYRRTIDNISYEYTETYYRSNRYEYSFSSQPVDIRHKK